MLCSLLLVMNLCWPRWNTATSVSNSTSEAKCFHQYRYFSLTEDRSRLEKLSDNVSSWDKVIRVRMVQTYNPHSFLTRSNSLYLQVTNLLWGLKALSLSVGLEIHETKAFHYWRLDKTVQPSHPSMDIRMILSQNVFNVHINLNH